MIEPTYSYWIQWVWSPGNAPATWSEHWSSACPAPTRKPLPYYRRWRSEFWHSFGEPDQSGHRRQLHRSPVLPEFVVVQTRVSTAVVSAVEVFDTESIRAEILVPVGRQELFDSGVLHYYDYGHLYNTSTKIIARTTTQDRMLKSAEYFMAGFFGLEWTNNATLELIIEQPGFNNSLAGYFQCNNSDLAVNEGGTNASIVWENIYLQNATQRLQALSPNFKLNVSDVYKCVAPSKYNLNIANPRLQYANALSLRDGCLWLLSFL